MKGKLVCALALAGCGGSHAPAADDGIGEVGGDPSAVSESDSDEGSADTWDLWHEPEAPICPAEPDGAAGKLVRADDPPPATSGGTLLLAQDGVRAFAADPDRDAMHLVDLVAQRTVASIALPAGSEPGRIVEDAQGRVHVALRGAGKVATIDPVGGVIVAEHAVCANPRGLAVDPADSALVVACAEGSIARVDAQGHVAHTEIGFEPRDIVDPGPPLRVSAWRTAEVIVLDEHGNVVAREAASTEGFATPNSVEGGYELNTARRTFASGDGSWVMLHQAAFAEHTEVRPGGYGGGHCLPLQTSVVTWQSPHTGVPISVPSSQIVAAFDFAISSASSWDDAQWLAMVGSSAEGWALDILPLHEEIVTWHEDCSGGGGGPPSGRVALLDDLPGAPTSVAFAANGLAWVQLREPARLLAFDPVTGQERADIVLSERAVADTGHELFHRATERRISCVACHPEGREDGIAWRFDDERRRSQALSVGLAGSEPFHWHGEMADLTQIVDEVHGERMCGVRLADEQIDALTQWIFALRPMVAARGDEGAIARGAEIFAQVGCATCHAGERYTNDLTMVVNGRELQVPTLRGVAFRPPFMHDGRAATMRAAVEDMLPISVPGGALSEGETNDLLAFLGSL